MEFGLFRVFVRRRQDSRLQMVFSTIVAAMCGVLTALQARLRALREHPSILGFAEVQRR